MMKLFKNKQFIIFFILITIFIGVGIFYLWQTKHNDQTMPNSLDCDDCNVVIISMTTVGANHLSTYGYNRETDTNIKKFAEDALVFDNAFTHSSQTIYIGTSLFTSLYPYSHKMLSRDHEVPFDKDLTTLAEVFKKNDYKTAAFTGGGDYDGKYGFDRGFDEYISSKNPYLGYEPNLPLATNFLEENKNNKFFMFFQGFDAHCPYDPPPPYDTLYNPDYEGNIDFFKCYNWFDENEVQEQDKNGEKIYKAFDRIIQPDGNESIKVVELTQEDVEHMRALYDGEIKKADDYLKKIFDTIINLKLDKKTIIIFLSEHGELLGEHGHLTRGGPPPGKLYDEVVHIPLIIKHPKIKKQKRIDGLVQIIDVMPTIMGILNMDKSGVNQELQGKSLLSLILEDKNVNDYVYGGSEFNPKNSKLFKGRGVGEMIRNKKWKLIRGEILYNNGSESSINKLYNLEEDPEELNNLWEQALPEAQEMNNLLSQWLEEVKR